MAFSHNPQTWFQNDADIIDLEAFQQDREAGTVVVIAREQLTNALVSTSDMRESMIGGFGVDPEAMDQPETVVETPALQTVEAAQAGVAEAVANPAPIVNKVETPIETKTTEVTTDGNSVEAIRARIAAINTADTTLAPDYSRIIELQDAA